MDHADLSGSTPPGLAPVPAAWSSFFIALAEVAATLAGLSFVAVSAHPSILRTVHTRYKAQRTLLTFVVVLVGALILAMPQQSAAVTTTVLWWSSVAGAALTLTSIVRESRSRQPRVWLRFARSLNSVEYLLAYGVAGGWALLHLAPTAVPLNPTRAGLGHDRGAGLVGHPDVAAAAGGGAGALARRAPRRPAPARRGTDRGHGRTAGGAQRRHTAADPRRDAPR